MQREILVLREFPEGSIGSYSMGRIERAVKGDPLMQWGFPASTLPKFFLGAGESSAMTWDLTLVAMADTAVLPLVCAPNLAQSDREESLT